jgi:hypothetical protein
MGKDERCRLLDLLGKPAGHSFLSGRIQREIIYRAQGNGRSALARSSNARRSKPQDSKSDCVDQRELC